jgi:hypothetical protein
MNFDLNGKDKPKYTISSDTDSAFINIGEIIKKMPNNNVDLSNQEQCIELIRKTQKEIGDGLNNHQSFLAKKLFNCDNHYFSLKPEFIIKKAYWSGKRRYALHLVDREGKEINKFTMMGLDIIKSNFSSHFREFGETLIKKILIEEKKPNIDKFIIDFKKSIKTVHWKLLLKPTGLKKINEYIQQPPQNGEIFSKLKLRCPINTRASIITTDLLKFKKLNDKYPIPQVGDKIYIAYLKPNPYRINVLALNNYNDAPELTSLVEKYIDREMLYNSNLKNKIDTIYSDLGWALNEKTNNNFFAFKTQDF